MAIDEDEAHQFVDWFKTQFFKLYGVTPEVEYNLRPKYTLEQIEAAVNTVLNRGSTQYYRDGLRTTYMRNGYLILFRKLYYKIAIDLGHGCVKAAKHINQTYTGQGAHAKMITYKIEQERDEQTIKTYNDICAELERLEPVFPGSGQKRSHGETASTPE